MEKIAYHCLKMKIKRVRTEDELRTVFSILSSGKILTPSGWVNFGANIPVKIAQMVARKRKAIA